MWLVVIVVFPSLPDFFKRGSICCKGLLGLFLGSMLLSLLGGDCLDQILFGSLFLFLCICQSIAVHLKPPFPPFVLFLF